MSWILRIFQVSDNVILEKSGLDAYFFLRYILILTKLFLGFVLVVIPVLIPLNALGGDNTSGPGLDRLNWTNIGHRHTHFYWAHFFMCFLVVIYTCQLIHKEILFYVRVRNYYFLFPAHRRSESANTVLITDIPDKDLTALKETYEVFPGGVRAIWINRNLTIFLEKIKKRQNLITTLEAAETRLIR